MSADSRHLQTLADHVHSGAHVVLRGHLGDEVLVEGRVVEEIWAIGHFLTERTGIEAVLLANQADGLHCLDPDHEERVAALLEGTGRAEAGAALGVRSPLGLANAVRALMDQEEIAVAIIVQDAGICLETASEQGRRAQSVFAQAMSEARFVGARGAEPARNALILYGTPSSRAVDQIAALPGVVEQTVSEPDRAERLAVLRSLVAGFYGAAEDEGTRRGLESIARLTYGSSARGLEQLRRRSHALKIPPSRPETLHRAARGESALTPVGRVGAEVIMAMLEDEVIGQPTAMALLRRLLEQGSWRGANRPPGSHPNRPMATMLLHGPSGVGKTETGLILGEAILGSRVAVRRFDCAEFQSRAELARLTGANPGYVGYEEGGGLTDALAADAAVIVFDEFNRASPELAELLLGVLDAGRLTDGRGRTSTFENAIVILTTNVGSGGSDQAKAGGLMSTEDLLKRSAESVERELKAPPGEGGVGSPALWSRLQDSLVGYDVLRRDALEAIVGKSCRNVASNLGDELDLRIAFEAEGFTAALADRLPPDGRWDGRSVAPLVGELIEVPARACLEGVPPGSEVWLRPDETGRATLRSP